MRTELEIKERLQEVTNDLKKFKDLSLASPNNLDIKSDVDFLKRRKINLEWVLGLWDGVLGKMSVDLEELEKRIDEVLENETSESLTKWLNERR